MKRSWIWGMGVAILVMLAIVTLSNNPRGNQDEQVGQSVLPGLKANLSLAEKVLLDGKDSDTTLQLTDDKWLVMERFQFEADVTKLTGLLRSLAESKLQERKTSKPENFGRLGLEEGTDDAVVLEIHAGGNTYSILVGNSDPKRKGQYIRLYDDGNSASSVESGRAGLSNQVWFIDTKIDVPSDPGSWLATQILDIEAQKVIGIELTDGDAVLKVSRVDDELKIEDLDVKAELRYPTVVDTLGRALVNVRMQDVVPATQVDFTVAKQAIFKLEDAPEIKLEVVQDDGKYWLRLIDHEKSDWAFEVHQIVFGNLTKRLEDFLKETEESG